MLQTYQVLVDSSSVTELCKTVLDRRRLDGLTYTVCNAGWRYLWTQAKVTITAPPGVLDSTKKQISAWQFEDWGDRQW